MKYTKAVLVFLGMALVSSGSAQAQTSEFDRVVGDLHKTQQGQALAAALGDTHMASDTRYRLNLSTGFYSKEAALSAQAATRLDETIFFDGGIGITVPDGTLGGRLAVSAEW